MQVPNRAAWNSGRTDGTATPPPLPLDQLDDACQQESLPWRKPLIDEVLADLPRSFSDPPYTLRKRKSPNTLLYCLYLTFCCG